MKTAMTVLCVLRKVCKPQIHKLWRNIEFDESEMKNKYISVMGTLTNSFHQVMRTCSVPSYAKLNEHRFCRHHLMVKCIQSNLSV